MGLRDIEAAVRAAAAELLSNPKLKRNEVRAFSSGDLVAEEGELLIHVHALDMRWAVVVPKSCDHRTGATSTAP